MSARIVAVSVLLYLHYLSSLPVSFARVCLLPNESKECVLCAYFSHGAYRTVMRFYERALSLGPGWCWEWTPCPQGQWWGQEVQFRGLQHCPVEGI